jgi:hypothetical protein
VNLQTAIVRTDPDKGGTEGLSAIIVERGTPGITYKYIDKEGHRLTSNAEVVFDNARVPAETCCPARTATATSSSTATSPGPARWPPSPRSGWPARRMRRP